MASDSGVHTTTTTYTGQVKWFNNKSGYGFITVLSEGDFHLKDIFVHHSSINVTENIYKYLVQGEYVQFNISKIEGKDHENQATKIKGIMDGEIMCEVRHKNRDVSKSRDNFTKIKSN